MVKGDSKTKACNELKTARQIAARQLIAAALQEAQRIPTARDKASAYRDIAQAQARAGDVAGARKSIEVVEAAFAEIYGKSGGDAGSYCEIAEIQILVGDVAAARQALEKAKAAIPSEKERWPADGVTFYELILPLQLQLGDKAGARESVDAAKRIAGELQRTDSYCTLAGMQIGLDDQKAARQSVETAKAIAAKTHIDNYDPRPEIARVQASLGDLADAKATLAGVCTDDVGKTNAYEDIAELQAGKGDFAGAKATIALIPEKHKVNREAALARIADAEAEAGRIASAKATVEGIDDRLKAIAYRRIGGVQVESGDFAGAQATAEQIRTPAPVIHQAADPNAMECRCARKSFAAILYRQIAEEQADAGDMTAARRCLTLAQDAARRSLAAADTASDQLKKKPDSGGRVSWLYTQSTAAQAMSGNVRHAIETIAKGEGDSLNRCNTLSWIVEELCAASDEESFLLFRAGIM